MVEIPEPCPGHDAGPPPFGNQWSRSDSGTAGARPTVAGSIGPLAQAALRTARGGKVLAVFSPAFYVELAGTVIAIGRRGVEPGPLTVLAETATDWTRIGLCAGQPVAIARDRIGVGGLFAVDLSGATTWSPPEPPVTWNIRTGLAALDALSPSSGIPGAPGEDVRPLTVWAKGGGDLAWARRLVGRGRGLTPAGDDFLCGALIALRSTNQDAKALELSDAIRGARTTPLSRAALDAAARGMGTQALHQAINAILAGGRGLGDAFRRLSDIGHTSGLDALAGGAGVLRAACEHDQRRAAQHA